MDRPSRLAIEKLANEKYAVACEDALEKRAAAERQALAAASRTGNSATYPNTLVELACTRVREDILNCANAYADAFTAHRLPADDQADKSLETAAPQIAAGAIAWVRGELDLYRRRTRRQVHDPGGYLHRKAQQAKRSALRKGKLTLQEQRINAKGPEADAGASSTLRRGESRVGVPTRPLSAISADQDRRAEAQKDLKQALLSYAQNLSRARDIDLTALAEIWGEYAVRLYDSLAESFIGLPVSREATFGEAGILAGGQTLEDVKKALNTVRFPRPEHWPPADTSRDADDDPETVKLVRELMCSDVSFGWLLEDPWFWNEIRDRVKECVREWKDSSTKPDRLQAIRDFGASLKKISPEDPDYKVWEAFCRASHKTEAQWVSDSARRALQGKPLDPNGAYKFVLRLFDVAVEAQVALVRDSESAAGCEDELRTLASGSLDYLENILTGTCDSQTIAEWRSKLELELLHRFGKAKERALELEAAQQADARRERKRAEMQPAADHPESKPAASKASGQPGQVQHPQSEHGKPAAQGLSERDQAVHQAVGEANFKILTNAEIMRDPNIGKQLKKDHKFKAGADATKSCLDRVRRVKGYPLSREITNKRSTQK